MLDWAAEFPQIRKRLEGFVKEGRLAYQEDIQHGFENAPATLKRLFFSTYSLQSVVMASAGGREVSTDPE